MNKDINSIVKTVNAKTSETISNTTPVAGEIIDTLGFNSVSFALMCSAHTTGDVSISQIEESDDAGMSGATVVPAARLIGSLPNVDAAGESAQVGVVASKRYLQATVVGANTPSLTVNSVAVKGHPFNAPTA